MSAVFHLTNKYSRLATSGPPEIWQDHQISRTGGPMVNSLNCLEMSISSPVSHSAFCCQCSNLSMVSLSHLRRYVFIVQYPVRCTAQASKRFTLHPLADQFILTPTQLLWEAFSHAVITARSLCARISTTVYSQVLIYAAA